MQQQRSQSSVTRAAHGHLTQREGGRVGKDWLVGRQRTQRMHSKSAKPCNRVRVLAHGASLIQDPDRKERCNQPSSQDGETRRASTQDKRTRKRNQELETGTFAPAFGQAPTSLPPLLPFWRNVESRGLLVSYPRSLIDTYSI